MASATRGTVPSSVRIRADALAADKVRVGGTGTSTLYAGGKAASDFSLHLGDGNAYLGGTAKTPALDLVPAGLTASNTLRSTADPAEYALANWTTRQLQPGVWRAFIYLPELGRYVGVGDNVVQTSEDGITWVSRTSPGNRWWNRLAWAGDKRVLVAAAADPGTNPIASSLDGGITWTARAAGTDPISAVAYGGGLFVALAADGTSHYTSPDGITWTARTAVRRIWSGLVWAEELGRFVAVSVNGSGGQAATSEGGFSFTTRATPVETNVNAGWRDVAWSGSLQLFVAVAASGAAGRIMTSPDGITWTSRSTPEQGEWNRVVWAEELGQFVVAARAQGDRRFRGSRTLTSPDGTNWTARVVRTEEGYGLHWVAGKGEMIMAADREQDRYLSQITPAWTRDSSVTGVWYGAAWAPEIGRVVIVGDSVIRFSTTGGTSWTTVNPSGNWRGVAWAPEINTFVAVADQGSSNPDRIAYSTTGGASWATLETGTGRRWLRVAWAPEISTFVAVAQNGFYARSTTGGISWEVTSRANGWYGVTWAPEIRTFVKVAAGGTNRISYSTTGGETWLNATGQTEQVWYGVAYSGELNRFVAVGSSAVSISTTGGVSWESKTIPSGGWYAVTWAPELRAFVAVGPFGIADFSTTGGDSWVNLMRPAGNAWSVAWLREYGRLIAPDTLSGVSRLDYPRRINNLFLTNTAVSRPSWRTEALAGAWYGIVWAPERTRFVAVANGNLVAYSTMGGSSWQTVTVTGAWNAVTYAPQIDRFVAVGGNGRFAFSSTGGESWVTASFGNEFYYKVVWAPEIQTFMAVAAFNGRYARSTDNGVTWATVERLNDWYGVAWAPEIRTFVKVADSGTNPRISYSTNGGISWLDATSPTASLYSVAWCPEQSRFVAVGNAAVLISTTGGKSWFAGTISGLYYNVIWAPEIQSFVATGLSGQAAFSTTGGLTWVQQNRPSGSGTAWGCAWAPQLGRLIAPDALGVLSIQEGYVVDSPAYALAARQNAALRKFRFDPAAPPAWTNESLTGVWLGAVYARELQRFVIVGNSVISFSTTGGNSWTTVNPAGGWNGVAWAPEINTFVAVADQGGSTDLLAYSTTGGASWATLNTGTGRQWFRVAWAAEISTFVAVAPNGFYARSTTGGTSWVVTARANNWYGVTWAPEIRTFVKVAAGGTNRISYSTTGGETWLDATGSVSQFYYGVGYSGDLNRFVAVGFSASCSISTTGGVSWVSRTIPSGNWWKVIWAPELRAFVAVGTSGVAAFSTTGGDSWVSFNRPSNAAYAVAWAPDLGTLLAPTTSSTFNRAFIPSAAAPSRLAITAGSRNVLTVTETGIAVRGTISSFTGCHKARWSDDRHALSAALNGLVVCATGEMAAVSLDDSVPHIRLASAARDPAAFGVLHVTASGGLLVNGLGEGAVWVCDTNGSLQNGEYVCTSDLPGYAARQDEDWAESFTVAKVLFDVDFSLLDTPDPVIPIPEEPAPEPTEEPAEPTPEGSGESAEPASEATGEATEPATGSTGESAEPAPETTGEATEPATDSTAAPTEPALETTGESAEPAPETTGESAEPAPETTGEASDPTTEANPEAQQEATPEAEEEPIEEIVTEGAVQSMAASAAASAMLAVRDRVYYGRTGGTTYEMRHLVRDPDGSVRVVKRAEWLERKAAGEPAFLAAFVGCTYHCA